MSNRENVLVYENGQASSLVVSILLPPNWTERLTQERQAIVLFAAISLLAICAVALRYSWDSIANLFKGRRAENQHHSRAFFHTQLGAYISSLMLSNAFSSISMMINGQWAVSKVATAGA